MEMDKVVVKIKASQYRKFRTSKRALFNPTAESRKSLTQLQTYQHMTIHLNWEAEEGAHLLNEKQLGSNGEWQEEEVLLKDDNKK